MTRLSTQASNSPALQLDNTPRFALTVFDEVVALTRYSTNGKPTRTDPVKAEHVAAAFNIFGADTGLLPANTLFWQQRGGHLRMGMYVPPATYRMTFDGHRAITVPMPGFVFVGHRRQYFVWATLTYPTAMTRLYHAPLPNIYPDGKVCEGSVRFPACAPDTLTAAFALVFESEFNSDLADGRIRTPKPMKFLRGLDKQRTFPKDVLVPAVSMNDVVSGAQTNARLDNTVYVDDADEMDPIGYSDADDDESED